MRIRLRERDPLTRRWHGVLDQRVGVSSCTRVAPLALNESSELSLFVHPDRADGFGSNFDARLLVGNFPVASTLEKDRPDYSAGMLLDVFGKTFVNLQLERRPGENAPILVLQRVRQVIDQLAASLRAIARRPAYRLKSRRLREPALAELAVSDLTLEEACLDPTLAVPL